MEIGFPLSISEMTKMREDGDIVSIYLSLGCIISFTLIFVFWFIFHFYSYTIFKTLSFISLLICVVCLSLVYYWRPIFLSDPVKKQKALDKKKFQVLDKLATIELEEGMRKLTPEELERYLSFETRKVAIKWVRKFWK